MSFVVFSD